MLQSSQKIIRHKVGLLNLAEELGNVSKACQIMGLSRDTFYRYRDAVEDGGVEALLEKPRRVPNLKNRIDIETENAVVEYAIEYPAHGQVRVSNELCKLGVFVSASGVRSIWLRHDLANFKSRLKALEAKVAEDGIILTEAQVQALEKKKLDDEAWGEIDTAHPGYLGSQDTFYVGTLKGVGRIYQQTYVDTYAKVHSSLLNIVLFDQSRIEKGIFKFCPEGPRGLGPSSLVTCAILYRPYISLGVSSLDQLWTPSICLISGCNARNMGSPLPSGGSFSQMEPPLLRDGASSAGFSGPSGSVFLPES